MLALCVLGVAAPAAAQTSPYGSPSLLPFPDSRPVSRVTSPSDYRTASSAPLPSSGYGPSFATAQAENVQAPDPVPQPPTADYGFGGAPPVSSGPLGTGMLGNSSIWNGTAPVAGPSSVSDGTPGCGQGGCMAGCVPSCTGCGGKWFGSLAGLIMTRNTGNAFWTTYQTGSNANQLVSTKDANGGWQGGWQATLGYWWCPNNCGGCGPTSAYGVQFVYWQLAPMKGYYSLSSPPNGLSTPIDMTNGNPQINYAGGSDIASAFFDNASFHEISRVDRVTNMELNFLHQSIYANPGRCNITCLAGFRYFQFSDMLTFGSIGSAHPNVEAYLQSNARNNMYGGQIGFLTNYSITPQLGVFAMPKFGVFGNQVDITNKTYTSDGFTTYNIPANRTVCSLMGELDLGAYWWLTPNCQAFVGWRAVGISQVALADNQFLPYLADTIGFSQAKTNGDLILTGGFAGLSFTF